MTTQKQTPKKNLHQIQRELGIDLVKQVSSEMSDGVLEIAFLDEESPHAFYLREIVCAALDVGLNTAREIVIYALEEELKKRKEGNWSPDSLLPPDDDSA